jgi:hypothetical protein
MHFSSVFFIFFDIIFKFAGTVMEFAPPAPLNDLCLMGGVSGTLNININKSLTNYYTCHGFSVITIWCALSVTTSVIANQTETGG